MGFGDYGGDGSVRIKTDARARKNSGGGSGPFADEFVDDVVDGNFVVRIKFPTTDVNAVRNQLGNALTGAGPYTLLTITLPIEPSNDSDRNDANPVKWPQIHVEWPDAPKPGAGHPPLRAARSASTKAAGGRKQARRKVAPRRKATVRRKRPKRR